MINFIVTYFKLLAINPLTSILAFGFGIVFVEIIFILAFFNLFKASFAKIP